MNNVITAGVENPEEVNVSFNWMLTDLCNYKCKYCFAGYGHDATRPTSALKHPAVRYAWKDVLSRLSLKNISKFNIDLVGGEPTLHPDINIIINRILELPNINELFLTTNFAKQLNFYTDLPSKNNFRIIVSYHSQYANEKTVEKIIDLNKTHNVNVQIMLTDDEAFSSHVERIVHQFDQHNVSYAGLYLFPTQTYIPKYTQALMDKYDKLFKTQKKYRFVTKTGIIYLTESEIMSRQLNKYKNWSCIARAWEITTIGEIVNICTRQNAALTLKNLNDTVICPHNKCECTGFWDYTKHDNTNNRS